jgi:hypothetical protein
MLLLVFPLTKNLIYRSYWVSVMMIVEEVCPIEELSEKIDSDGLVNYLNSYHMPSARLSLKWGNFYGLPERWVLVEIRDQTFVR